MGKRAAAGAAGEDASGARIEEYFEIPTNLYQPEELISKDLFLLYQGEYILYRPRNLRWKSEDATRLVEFGVKSLYIKCFSRDDHHMFLESNLQKILDEPKIDQKQKAQIILDTSTSIVEQIFKRPSSPENVKRSVGFVKNSIDYLKDRANFYELMKMASSDFSEYTHAIQTSAYAISLARQMGMKNFNDLSAIGVGSILHDVGKSKIDRAILDKAGRLDESERREVQKHPEYGYEILHRQRTVPEMAEQIVLQHHERPDGRGYPYRLGGEVCLSARIVSLVDCFDSLTSDRPFMKKMKPADAIAYMRSDLKDEYDSKLLHEFIKVLAVKK